MESTDVDLEKLEGGWKHNLGRGNSMAKIRWNRWKVLFCLLALIKIVVYGLILYFHYILKFIFSHM